MPPKLKLGQKITVDDSKNETILDLNKSSIKNGELIETNTLNVKTIVIEKIRKF